VSWEVARALDGRSVATTRWLALQLPCEFQAGIDQLERALSRHEPCAVLCLGQAEGRSRISLERVAINLRDARIPDNAGRQPLDEPICPDGPYAYPSRLPIRALTSTLLAEGYPVEISNTAGTFVCNDVFYGLMHLTRDRNLAAGFVHLPIMPEQLRAESHRSTHRDDAPRSANGTTPWLALALQIATIARMGESLVRISAHQREFASSP
jgi:pyroglutamyl-peptidase